MLGLINNDDELVEKRIELRQKLKSQLLTLSSPQHDGSAFLQLIPNFRDFDFLEKQGLDCIRNYLIDDNPSDFPEQLSPYVCSICRVDSTENWWCSSSDNQQVLCLCDQCEQNRIRQAILEQHRQSMKLAFLQAKESERRLEVNYHTHKKE